MPALHHIRLRFAPALAAVAMIVIPGIALGANDTVWTGTASGDWSDAANWDAGVPTASGTAHAFLSDPAALNTTITLPGDATAAQLVTTGSGYTLTSGTLTLSDQLYVYGSGAELTLSGGARVTTPNSTIGSGAGDSGNTLTIGATLEVAATITVGYEATAGLMRLTGGGSLTAPQVWLGGLASATGNAVTVASGATLTSGSQVIIGLAGGSSTFTNAGTVSAEQTIIGNGADGNSLTILSGGGWTNANTLLVGNSGTGNGLQVNAGGTLTKTGATDVVLGQAAASAGNSMTLDGGTFTSTGASTLYVGGAGSGNSFVARNGATASVRNVRVGRDAGSIGNTATVEGVATTLTIGNKLRVGNDGGGNSFEVRSGGQVTVASDIFVGGYGVGSTVSDNAILVTGSGSKLTITSPTADLVISYGSGTNNSVTVADGGTLDVSSVKMGPGGRLAIGSGGAPGSVKSTAVITGSAGSAVVFDHNDPLCVFDSAIAGLARVVQRGTGRTVISGSANTSTGKTLVESGTLALAGVTNPIAASTAIDVSSGAVLDVGGVLGGFALASGQTLAGKGTVSGAVTSGPGSTVAPGLGDIGMLSFASNLDFEGLLAIDVSGTGADSIAVAGALTLEPSSTLGFTVDGTLTEPVYVLATYTSLLGTFGSVTNLPSGYQINYAYEGDKVALQAVPEPGSIVLAAIGGCCLIARARRRRQSA